MATFVQVNLNLPSFSFKTRSYNGGEQIFDPIRRRFVPLTPEEWVRQHCINYLIQHKKVPAGLTAVEVFLAANGVNHRADIVVYNRQGNPLVVVECKAPGVELNSLVIDQITRYNLYFRAKYLFITNGLKHYNFLVDWDEGRFSPLGFIPSYTEMIE